MKDVPDPSDAPIAPGPRVLAWLYRWLESRIDVFTPFDEQAMPPRGVWAFCGTMCGR